jgi:hypothetical protein
MTIRNIIYMTLAIIMELLNTIRLKTGPNTTPAGPKCVNSAFHKTTLMEVQSGDKTHFSHLPKMSNLTKKKSQAKFSLCMKAQREVETQLHPSITSTLHTGQWLD